MKVIVISNRKGGVGKTSIATNIAFEISRMGFVTVLVDMDSQCDLTKVYLQVNHGHPNILDVFTGKETIGVVYCIIEMDKGDFYLAKNTKKTRKIISVSSKSRLVN